MGRSVKKIEEYVHQAYTELNPLTGLLYNKAFLKEADEFIKNIEANSYLMLAVDIVHFKLFNKIYGRDAGDKVLVDIAKKLSALCKKTNGLVGYIGADNFCVILPNNKANIEKVEKNIEKCLEKYNGSVCFYPVIGVYEIIDTTLPAVVMYDKATMATARAKDVLSSRVCSYDEEVEKKIEDELKLLVEIQEGLEKEEFTFFAQPQCDIATGKIVGAESLVRWNHSEKGLVPPGVFIPVLEKNGLIAELDRYVWKKVCKWLREWIDKGYNPVPISINVSRVDIFSMDVPAYLEELIKTYNISPKLLKVEITEGAYAENGGDINKTVKALRDVGFIVMMDDFGSGYSSLNMLKNVAVDVLKLDMRFLDIDGVEEKGIGIIESVVNMARIMGLPIIVEGVENEKQEAFLLKMGCRYTQGYYYYRPLPVHKFEELMTDERKLDYDGLRCRQVEEIKIREFLDGNLFTDAMVNNVLGATAFYDVYDGKIEITRVNKQYYQLTGVAADDSGDETHLGNHVRDDDKQRLLLMFEKAYENPKEGATGYIHYMRIDGKVLWVYMRIFFLSEADGHKVFYGALVDMTDEQATEHTEVMVKTDEFGEAKLEQMREYYGDMPYGYAVGKLVLNEENDPVDYVLVYANYEMEEMCMGRVDKLRYMIEKLFPNVEEMLEKVYRAAYMAETVEYYEYSEITRRYIQITFHQFTYGYVGCIVRDVTHTHIYEDAVNSIMSGYREVYHLNIKDNYFRMIYPDESDMLERGEYEEGINRHFGMGKIIEHNGHAVRKFLSLENIKSELKYKDRITFKYRRSAPDGTEEWCHTSIAISSRENGEPKTAIIRIRSIEEQRREDEERRRQNMAETLASMSEGFFIYRDDEKEEILYANSKVVEMFGCDSQEEFEKYVKKSFKGMVYPDDLARIEWEIKEQINKTEGKMDYIRYRIKRKDGKIRWIDDCGHLVEGETGQRERLFYVFISDITDEMTTQQQKKLISQNKFY